MKDKVKIEIELSHNTVTWLNILVEKKPEASHIPDSLKGLVEHDRHPFCRRRQAPGFMGAGNGEHHGIR